MTAGEALSAASPPPVVRGLDFSDDRVVRALRRNRLLLLTLLSPGACNLRCPYCFTSVQPREGNVLGLADYLRHCRDARELGAEAVWWVGQGEPLLTPWWREFLAGCNELGLWAGVFTNGTQLDGATLEFLVERNCTLYIKLNSFDPIVQGRLIGGDGQGFLDTVIPAIEWLVEAGLSQQRRLAVETVITRLNLTEIPGIFRWCRDRQIIPFVEMMEHACSGARTLDVKPADHVALFRRLRRIDSEEYGYSWTPAPPWVAYTCRNLYCGVAVHASGDVTPCSGSRYRLGNLGTRSLRDIWLGAAARRIRDPEHLEPSPWDGKTLGGYGCFSHALHMTDRLGDPDPRIGWFDQLGSERCPADGESEDEAP